jgi:hypothetical protein
VAVRKASARAVSTTPVPVSSTARRAAFTRSRGELERIERLVLAPRRILDREAGDTGRDAELDVGGDAVGVSA